MSAPVPDCIADPTRSCHLDVGSHGPREVHDHPVSAPVPDATGDQAGALDLDAIEARVAAAPRGPWEVREGNVEVYFAEYENYGVVCTPSDDAAQFIAHARQDVPALVAEVRRLREERDAIALLDWPGEAHRLNAALHFARGTIDDLAATVERLEAGAP